MKDTKKMITNKQGWEHKKLKDICEKITDGTHQTPKYFETGHIFLSSKNVTSGKIDWDNVKFIDDVQHLEMQKRVSPKKGDILLAKNGTTGVAAIVDKDVKFDIYVSLAWLRSKGEVLPEYLLHFINSPIAKSQFNKRLKGIGVPNLHLEEIREVDISFPKSLPEQRRIVAILDEAFAAIAKAKANAEQNLKNAKELFEGYLQGVFERKGDGWEERKLGEVAKINYGYTEKASFEELGPKFLRITDIQENGVDWKTVPYCKCSDKDLPKYKLETGDIVFARTGATTGKSYLISNPPNSVFASYLIRLRMNSINEFVPEFIYNFFQTGTYWDKINAGIAGAAQGGFNATKLGELELHFPKSKEQQQSIVLQLDTLRAQTQKLEAVYRKKLEDLEELKKSILQKAFAGELRGGEPVELKPEKAVTV